MWTLCTFRFCNWGLACIACTCCHGHFKIINPLLIYVIAYNSMKPIQTMVVVPTRFRVNVTYQIYEGSYLIKIYILCCHMRLSTSFIPEPELIHHHNSSPQNSNTFYFYFFNLASWTARFVALLIRFVYIARVFYCMHLTF